MMNLFASPRLLMLGLILLSLTACGTKMIGMGLIPAGIKTPPVCSVWRDISYSGKKDTPETVAEVRASNKARGAYCS